MFFYPQDLTISNAVEIRFGPGKTPGGNRVLPAILVSFGRKLPFRHTTSIVYCCNSVIPMHRFFLPCNVFRIFLTRIIVIRLTDAPPNLFYSFMFDALIFHKMADAFMKGKMADGTPNVLQVTSCAFPRVTYGL